MLKFKRKESILKRAYYRRNKLIFRQVPQKKKKSLSVSKDNAYQSNEA